MENVKKIKISFVIATIFAILAAIAFKVQIEELIAFLIIIIGIFGIIMVKIKSDKKV